MMKPMAVPTPTATSVSTLFVSPLLDIRFNASTQVVPAHACREFTRNRASPRGTDRLDQVLDALLEK